MSTYVHIACKDCKVISEWDENHGEQTVADILTLLPEIAAFNAASARVNTWFSIHLDESYRTGGAIGFATEHACHDLYIQNEYGHYGKTIEEYWAHYRSHGTSGKPRLWED